MKEMIKEALRRVESADWVSQRFEDGYPYMSIMGTDCVNVAENAPEWLRWQNERIEQLEKAMEEINKTYMQYIENEIECDTAAYRMDTIADKALGKE